MAMVGSLWVCGWLFVPRALHMARQILTRGGGHRVTAGHWIRGQTCLKGRARDAPSLPGDARGFGGGGPSFLLGAPSVLLGVRPVELGTRGFLLGA